MRAASSAREAIAGADVVLCTTNSLRAVIASEWAEPGQHIGTIREGELDPALLNRASQVVVHHRANMRKERIQAPADFALTDALTVAEGNAAFAPYLDAPDLAELITSGMGTRNHSDEITLFLNYHGIALQFAAVGASIYRRAVQQGLGRELPTDWFTQAVHS